MLPTWHMHASTCSRERTLVVTMAILDMEKAYASSMALQPWAPSVLKFHLNESVIFVQQHLRIDTTKIYLYPLL
jgi:hypothetical protein